MRPYLFIAALIASSNCFAQTVYKCKDANGAPIFTQQPCSADPAKFEVMQIKGIGQADESAAAAARASEEEGVASRAESRCINDRLTPIIDQSNQRIRDYDGRIAALENRILYAKNNLAGATWESGMREEIAALRTSISSERISADGLAASARKSCTDERRAKREDTR